MLTILDFATQHTAAIELAVGIASGLIVMVAISSTFWSKS